MSAIKYASFVQLDTRQIEVGNGLETETTLIPDMRAAFGFKKNVLVYCIISFNVSLPSTLKSIRVQFLDAKQEHATYFNNFSQLVTLTRTTKEINSTVKDTTVPEMHLVHFHVRAYTDPTLKMLLRWAQPVISPSTETTATFSIYGQVFVFPAENPK